VLGVAVAALVAFVGLGQVDRPAVLLGDRPEPVGWPVELRYEVELLDDHEPFAWFVHEFGGAGWREWADMIVDAAEPGRRGETVRLRDGVLERGRVEVDADAPAFAVLAHANDADLDEGRPCR
jgi:hypothetical protein